MAPGGQLAARAAPYEKGTETERRVCNPCFAPIAARAAPYEKGTETDVAAAVHVHRAPPRARPPMRRGLKRLPATSTLAWALCAARAAPYEKGTET